MIDPAVLTRVEDALSAIETSGTRLTFVAVAQRSGISRASLYRNPELRALIEERRTRGRDARTLTGLSADIAQLHDSLEAVVTQVRQQEVRLRRLEGQPREPDSGKPQCRTSFPAAY